MAAIDQDSELNRPHTAKVTKGIQGGAHRAAGIKDIINKHDVPVVDVRRDFGFLYHGLRRNACQVVTIQIDIECADLRLALCLFRHPNRDPAGHRDASPLNSDENDWAAIVRFQDFCSHPVECVTHIIGFHQLIVQLQSHGGENYMLDSANMNEVDLSIDLAGVHLNNPIIAASGTFGYGEEFQQFGDLRRIGAICVKGTSAHPIDGNLPPRLFPTASGMLNSIGLENVGVDAFIRDKMPFLRNAGCAVFVNIFGFTEDEYAEVVDKLNGCDGIAAYELNISCPNTKHGGMVFGQSPSLTQQLTKMLKTRSRRPIIVKLSPNVTDITEFARAAEDAGADALTVANTFLGMAIDPETFKPRVHTITAGLSGPAIRPITLRMVYQCAHAVKIPVIGLGGISKAEDAVEYFLAGANAVQIGTANFYDPKAPLHLLTGLEKFLKRKGLSSVCDLVGQMKQ